MARKFKPIASTGRQTVLPFTKKEADDMRIMCKKKRQIYASGSHDWAAYQWDRNYMLIDMGLNSALRIEDLVQIKVSEQVRNGYIDIKEFKTSRNKPFELNTRIKSELKEYIERNNMVDGQYLFESRKGFNQPMTRQQAYYMLKGLAAELGIVRKIGCHSMRKTFGKLYYDQTKDLVGLHQMIHSGKGDPTVTLLYIGMVDSEVQEKRKKFDI